MLLFYCCTLSKVKFTYKYLWELSLNMHLQPYSL